MEYEHHGISYYGTTVLRYRLAVIYNHTIVHCVLYYSETHIRPISVQTTMSFGNTTV